MQAFKKDTEGSVSSTHQCDVAHVLTSLGVCHDLNHITSDGFFCADILITGHHVLIQVDGPHHWTSNIGQPIGESCCLQTVFTCGQQTFHDSRLKMLCTVQCYQNHSSKPQ